MIWVKDEPRKGNSLQTYLSTRKANGNDAEFIGFGQKLRSDCRGRCHIWQLEQGFQPTWSNVLRSETSVYNGLLFKVAD